MTIAVIGAGTMGRGIAYAAAFGGYVLLRKYVAEGWLGRKTGRGVYDYSQQKVAKKKA